MEIIATRRQKLATCREINAVDTSFVLPELTLEFESLHEGFEGVAGLLEGGESEDGVGGELAGVEVVEGVPVDCETVAVAVHC